MSESFYEACKNGNNEIIREMLKNETIEKDYSVHSGIYHACQYGNLETVKLLDNSLICFD